ncbi:MAG: hypothetical protein DWQ44_00215 [Bacteroidetes bacterium]|nr:MAG: hypothetical protein DWQ33_05165 [Bacteroidota bacterium]REK06053.1 MAG: hypothetical protein DWQ39_04305 [Bacteroidota bacterium]REK37111.1 MAG: hypothetical protein DWQ44_00215 [Bacteroidota bacterium]
MMLALAVNARQNVGQQRVAGPGTKGQRIAAGCSPSKSKADLDVNNVRCPIHINGDMWWDLVGNAEYEVPVGSGKHSMFAGAIWIGGKDGAGNLKVAAQTYRQSGSDFWPGPVDTTNATITNDVCVEYDKHWKITLSEVRDFVNYFNDNQGDLSGYPVPDVIKTWPGNGDLALKQGRFLAPFHDNNNDGIYNYQDGDYPRYNLSPDAQCGEYLLGDQTIWWVFNDVGNIHTETGSQFTVGVEIQAQAFGFNTNDEINNMTFYKYKIINRASQDLRETYFGSWIDPDLGNYLDDYVGCDVQRGFGYCYNGDADDDGALGYGANPPAIGVDFFEGPLADANDGKDNNRNGVVDEPGEQIIMSKFVYYNNDFTNIGNPSTAQHYYNYMRGIWKDGSPLVYGGNGYQTAGADSCDFMFPGDTDPTGWGTGGVTGLFAWSEDRPTATGGTPNEPSDRRFLQSAGSFTLRPGAVNFITTGVVWARTSSGGPLASVKLVRLADDKAQILFDNCFKIVDGPDAPDLAIRELNKELIFSIQNPQTSNNFKELYQERDPAVTDTISFYRFEGYKVYQLKDASVAPTDLNNPDRARLIFQCDIQNGIAQIVNQYFQPDINAFLPVEEVNGENKGLRHTFRITNDAFATGDPTLVNHKTYYFMAIAYAYNPDQNVFDPYEEGLSQPYLAGRRNSTGSAINVYTAIPHIPQVEAEGLVLNTFYGDGPEITRVTGIGNGYLLGSDRKSLDLKQDQVENMIRSNSSRIEFPTYQRARGPVDVRIYDAVKVAPAEYELWLLDSTTTSGRWVLRNNTTGRVDSSVKTLEFPFDQLFPDYGFYVSMNQTKRPGETPNDGNGLIEATISYSTGLNRWLGGIKDNDAFATYNWIRAGKTEGVDYRPSGVDLDGSQIYEKMINGTWAPYRLVSKDTTFGKLSPAPPYGGSAAGNASQLSDNLNWYNSVDIVLTSDQSMWSRCVVIETQDKNTRAQGFAQKGLIRQARSVNKDGSFTAAGDSGFSWFPGYAVDVETGERLNIAFGEDSYLTPANGFPGETGGDMRWNPTSTTILDNGTVVAGGKHFIYVFGRKNMHNVTNPNDTAVWGGAYDGCQHIYHNLWKRTTTSANFRNVWKDCMWVGVPLLQPGQSLLAEDVKIRIRVTRPYRQFTQDSTLTFNNYFPHYKFNTFELVSRVKQTEVAKDALQFINVVPNPYYAYSSYERNQLDNRVKIVNLPSKCTVTIYTPSGTIIRKFNRSVSSDNSAGAIYPDLNLDTSLDWDLKNTVGVPISSGMYIIHVSAPGIGERTIKWFGVMRPLDLDTF